MPSATQTIAAERQVSTSNATVWTGRIISAIVVLFFTFDAVMKLIKDPHVLAASADLGYPVSSIVAI
ncbi:MAG TPA: DoxX family protein, partial [Candidatus Angelobacter sp.]|nr:DoxX family protein [Candidatus Angelobacter sp.]